MRDETLIPHLAAPGPVPVPHDVAQAMAAPLIHHRTEAFSQIMLEVREGLRWLMQTEAEVAVLTGSGSVGMEAALVNFADPGGLVLSVGGGKFGCRWAEIAKAWRLPLIELAVPWGDAVSLEALEAALRAHPKVSMVTLSACETSTGVWHPLEEIAALVRRLCPEALLLVDGITALGAHPVAMDALGLDVLVAGSQKVFAVPPGLAFVAVSGRAMARRPTPGLPRYTMDLGRELAKQAMGQTAFSPAISLVRGMQASLRQMRQAGLEALWARHALHAEATRAGVQALGLDLLTASPCNAVTACRVPEGRSAGVLLARVLALGTVMAGGQMELADRIVRIGHLGSHTRRDMVDALANLELAMHQLGWRQSVGGGVSAALEVYARGLKSWV